ncbi:MAG: hypothetical protein M0041_02245 [Nitrospiraceae bacterium]|nr:hypothetical protein [Nitrospiraceae bacterium]
MDTARCLSFGTRVLVRSVLVRVSLPPSPLHGGRRRVWIERPLPSARKGLYLGQRVLKNGTVDLNGAFFPEDFVPANLVCFDDKKSPVYVPVTACTHPSHHKEGRS